MFIAWAVFPVIRSSVGAQPFAASPKVSLPGFAPNGAKILRRALCHKHLASLERKRIAYFSCKLNSPYTVTRLLCLSLLSP